MWRAGQIIGNYKLVTSLRSGGMATLFLAERIGAAGFTRPVAIKLIHPELQADEQFRQMFLDEALLASRIHHPNVVQVEELAVHEGSHYLVMEFVHGCSLAQLMRVLYLRQRRLTPAFAVRIAMHVAEGLHAAHECVDDAGQPLGVVHRDVSPENVLLAYGGHVKLIDFGIAKAFGRRHRTQEGLLKGKFRYMTPEQGYARPVDRRTDVYQLGIVLWEMLTLRRLFDAENDADLIQQVRSPQIVRPSKLVDRIPPALDDAVMAALSFDPSRRPPDAQTFARMLAKAVPDAFAVDAGALKALLEAAMVDERRRQAETFPPAVFAELEREVETLRYGSPGAGALQSFTVEHEELDWDRRTTDPSSGRATVELAPQQREGGAATEPEVQRDGAPKHDTQHGYGSPGRGASERAQQRRGQRRVGRARRLVRLASGIRTSITRIGDSEWAGSPVSWLAGGALAAFLLVAVAVGFARRARSGPPPLVAPPALPVLAPRAVQLAGDDAGAPVQLAEEPGPEAPAAAPAPDPAGVLDPWQKDADARRRGERHAPRRARSELDVDGTPLLADPGF